MSESVSGGTKSKTVKEMKKFSNFTVVNIVNR